VIRETFALCAFEGRCRTFPVAEFAGFKDLGGDTLDKVDVYIGYCDAVVHLVGSMTGADPSKRELRALLTKYPDLDNKLPPLDEVLKKGVAVSYTQWEAWLALYHGKRLFIAKAAESCPYRKLYPTGAKPRITRCLRSWETFSN
jgi:hypothetical protein